MLLTTLPTLSMLQASRDDEMKEESSYIKLRSAQSHETSGRRRSIGEIMRMNRKCIWRRHSTLRAGKRQTWSRKSSDTPNVCAIDSIVTER